MAAEGPILIGIRGVVTGERFPLVQGQEIFIGRSNTCEIALIRCRRWTEMAAGQQQADNDFNTVSRRHLRLACRAADDIEIEDLSANGTYVDGQKITKQSRIVDLQRRPHEIQLGTRECFRLEWP